MDTNILKQKILDLAIQGKLVQQNLNDEPASILLEKIYEEKKQMVKDGKLKSKDIQNDTIIYKGEDNLHYEKFVDGTIKSIEEEIPFDIPDSWCWVRLGNLGIYKKGPFGSSITKSMFIPDNPEAIKVYEQKNAIQKDDTLGTYYITKEKYDTLKNFEVFPNDIIVSCAGTIGETYIMPNTMRKGIINQALMKITLFEKQMLKYYLLYFDFKLKQYAQKHGYGVALKNIPPFDILKQYLIPIPPLNEQDRIMNKINVFLNLIENINIDSNNIKNTILLTKSKILELAIQGKLVPQNPEDEPASVLLERIKEEKEELIKQGKIKRDKKESIIFKGDDNSYYRSTSENIELCTNLPFELPNGWEWCNLSMIGYTNIGLTYKPTDIVQNGTMVLRSSNIINGKIDLTDLVRVNTKIRDNQYIEENDILICVRNGSKALVGKCAIFKDIFEKASFGAFMAVYRTQFYKYVYYFLNSKIFRDTFMNDDSKQINQLTQDMIKNTIFALPPLAEQKRIIKSIEIIFKQIDNILNNI